MGYSLGFDNPILFEYILFVSVCLSLSLLFADPNSD